MNQPPRPDHGTESPVCESPAFQRWSLLIIIITFCALAMEYMKADLWMDELLTLMDYGSRRHWADILRQYQVANNHILFSILVWFWLRVLPIITEEMVRFPNLLMGLGTLLIMHRYGRRLFGPGAGYLLTVLWALSPIYLAFFYQLRGYGLTLLLALLATIGAFQLLSGRRSGLAMFALPAVLLPVVIPSNLLLNASLLAFLFLVFWRRGELGSQFSTLIICGLAAGAGMLVYVPIWEKFLNVAQQTAGWQSGWLVVAHWGVALLVHAGLFVLVRLALERRQRPDTEDTGREDPLVATLPWLLLCCLVPLVLVGLIRAPYPRSFLAYLAPLTFCALIGLRRSIIVQNRTLALLTFFLLANGLVAFQMTHFTTEQRLLAGETPQNLLQQFYSRSQDVSTSTRFLVNNESLPPVTKVFIDFHYYLSLDFNWKRYSDGVAFGQPQWQTECLNGTELFRLKQPKEAYPFYPQLILGYNERQARNAYRRTVGYDVTLEPMLSPTRLRIFQVVGMGQGQMPEAPLMPTPPGEDDTPLTEDNNLPISYPLSP